MATHCDALTTEATTLSLLLAAPTACTSGASVVCIGELHRCRAIGARLGCQWRSPCKAPHALVGFDLALRHCVSAPLCGMYCRCNGRRHGGPWTYPVAIHCCVPGWLLPPALTPLRYPQLAIPTAICSSSPSSMARWCLFGPYWY